MTARTLLASIAMVMAFVATAEERKDGPGIPFRDDLIAHLVGDWQQTRTIRGREVKGVAHGEWTLEHQFLRLHMKSEPTPSGLYEADVYIGWSNTSQRYVIHWLDVWGGHFSMRGDGRRSGDSIEFAFPDADGTAFYNTFTYDRAADAWSMKLENADKAGKRSPFASERLKR